MVEEAQLCVWKNWLLAGMIRSRRAHRCGDGMSGLDRRTSLVTEEGDISELLCLITGTGEDQMIGGVVGFILRSHSSVNDRNWRSGGNDVSCQVYATWWLCYTPSALGCHLVVSG